MKWTSKHLPLWRLKIILADTLILWFFIPDERKDFSPLSGLSKFYFYSYVNFVWLSRKVEKFSAQDHYYFSSHENMKRLSNLPRLISWKSYPFRKKKNQQLFYISQTQFCPPSGVKLVLHLEEDQKEFLSHCGQAFSIPKFIIFQRSPFS